MYVEIVVRKNANVKNLLEDNVFGLASVLMVASSLDIKGNKAIKKNFVSLANWSVFPNAVSYFTCLYTSHWVIA